MILNQLPEDREEHEYKRPLVGLLRRLTQGDQRGSDPARIADETIETNLLVITYLIDDGHRKWIFGEYRDSDDILLHAIEVPIQTPELKPGEPMEMWLFRNRFELARIYESLRRESSGLTTPLVTLRDRPGYLACFLAAPHRAVG